MSTSYSRTTGFNLTGLVSLAAGNTSMTGVNTLFTTELEAGDFLEVAGQFFKVERITSATALVTSNPAGDAITSRVAALRDAPAFLKADEATYVTYRNNAEVSDPAVRALGIKTPGWTSYKTYTTHGGTVTRRVVEPMAHINPKLVDVQDKANIIIVGASLMEYSFGNATQGSAALKDSLAALATALGYRGTVVGRGVAGATLASTITLAPTIKAEFAATQGNNLYVVHCGGNDVSNRRPYDDNEAAFFNPKLTELFELLAAGDDEVVWMPLSKRLYQSGDTVVAGDANTDVNGSLPYNEELYYPFFQARTPKWLESSGSHKLDFYEFVERHKTEYLTVADGVHPHTGSFIATQQFVLGKLLGVSKAKTNSRRLRRGKSFMIGFANSYPTYSGNQNWIRMDGQGLTNEGKGVGALVREFTSGEVDPFVEVACTGFRGFNTAGLGDAANTLVADSRLHGALTMGRSVYFDSAKGTVANVYVKGLVEGETGLATFVGSRNIADSVRQVSVSISATANTLNAANNAASNQCTIPFTVDSSGELTITFTRSGTNTAYFGGMILDFY